MPGGDASRIHRRGVLLFDVIAVRPGKTGKIENTFIKSMELSTFQNLARRRIREN